MKGLAFFVFGVLCSPMLFGMFAPMVAWEMTASPVMVAVATVVSFSAWAAVWSWMIEKKWHYHI